MSLFRKIRSGAANINEYFADAVWVYRRTADPVVRLAALSAAKVAAGAQRASMVNYLRVTAQDERQFGGEDAAYQLNQLADEISLRDWGMRDSVQSSRALRKLDAEYSRSLDRFDAGVFRRRFPELFRETPDENLSADSQSVEEPLAQGEDTTVESLRRDGLPAVDVTAEADRFFDDSSLPGDGPPQFALVLGPTATGKTRHRRQKYARGYVVVDAADIFNRLSRDAYLDFPSVLEEPLEVIGAAVARRAVRERRHIVTEIIGHEAGPTQQLIDALLQIGYKVNLDYVHKDVARAWEWNVSRGDDNISAYSTPSLFIENGCFSRPPRLTGSAVVQRDMTADRRRSSAAQHGVAADSPPSHSLGPPAL